MAVNQPQPARAAKAFGGMLLLALFTLLLSAWQVRASGFFDGFEAYALGSLDSNLSGGANEGVNGGVNPWFGANPTNLRVVGAEYGVTPHSGTNMVRGCANCLYDNDVEWFNLSYRCATGGVFSGNIALDWWFFDPLGSSGGGDYVDYIALGNYAPVPPDIDYDPTPTWPVVNSQRMSLGADASRLNTNIDATLYQARIVGATDGVNPEGWFNLTNAPRSSGWHHARIVIGAPNGTDTPASFYIDNMITPALTHATVNADGFNLLEVDADFGNTTGYFDDLALQDNVTAPTFTTGPTNVTVLVGGNANFAVSGASGSPMPSYYWQRNGAALTNSARITGVNTNALAIAGVLAGDEGTYSCLVSNIAGVAVATATLSVLVPPTIDSQVPPGGPFSAGSGGTVNLSVTAHATHSINYLWNKNNGPLSDGGHVSGVTNSTLTLTGVDSTDVGTYSCHLSNADGATDSLPVILSLASGPTIVAQPAAQTVALSSNATFSVTAAGSSLVYLWSKGTTALSNGGRIFGATSSALTISAVIDADAGSYSCLITNSGGSTNTSAVALTVIDPPIITTQPVSQVANIGNTIGFHVTATGTAPAYQWKKSGAALTNAGDFSGVATPDLNVHVTTPADVGIYTVTVSNLAGSVTSAGAALRVNQTVTNFFDDFETYSILSPISYGRGGTALDYNYRTPAGDIVNTPDTCPWWGHSPANFCTFVSYQDGTVPAYSGSQMIGGAYASVSVSGDNDESFLNLAYRFNGGQLYYGDIMLDYYFYDPGTPDASDQVSLANFGTGIPPTSDASGNFVLPLGPVQNLFIGTWPNLNTNVYQAGVMGAADGTSGLVRGNRTEVTKYFDTAVPRSLGWHRARIVVGPADPGTHVASVQFFVDDMSNAAFRHDLPPGNVGFNSIHLMSCSILSPATSATAGYFDTLTFKAENDPYIVQQPVSLTNDFGTTAIFNVVGMATSYQWQKNNAAINGATNAALTLNSVSLGDAGSYTCVLTGANGSIISSAATLTVTGSPPYITSIIPSGTNFIINFVATASDPASAFKVLNGAVVTGVTNLDAAAVITGGGGVYQATVPASGPSQFYRIQR
jgi:hypothetical protein